MGKKKSLKSVFKNKNQEKKSPQEERKTSRKQHKYHISQVINALKDNYRKEQEAMLDVRALLETVIKYIQSNPDSIVRKNQLEPAFNLIAAEQQQVGNKIETTTTTMTTTTMAAMDHDMPIAEEENEDNTITHRSASPDTEEEEDEDHIANSNTLTHRSASLITKEEDEEDCIASNDTISHCSASPDAEEESAVLHNSVGAEEEDTVLHNSPDAEEEGTVVHNSPDDVQAFIDDETEVVGEKRSPLTTVENQGSKRQKRISLTFTLEPDKLEEGLTILTTSPPSGIEDEYGRNRLIVNELLLTSESILLNNLERTLITVKAIDGRKFINSVSRALFCMDLFLQLYFIHKANKTLYHRLRDKLIEGNYSPTTFRAYISLGRRTCELTQIYGPGILSIFNVISSNAVQEATIGCFKKILDQIDDQLTEETRNKTRNAIICNPPVHNALASILIDSKDVDVTHQFN